jgi:hypothetical protein
MTDEIQSHSGDQHDRTYEPPAVSPLGAVDSFTKGDNLSSVDDRTGDALTQP